MTNYHIYLFRHGQTYYNKNKFFTGLKDSKLTPLGFRQAKTIAKKLKNKEFQIAFRTSLSRSRDTLKQVLKYHPECEKIIIDNLMTERNYGALSGTSHESFIKRVGKKEIKLIIEGDALEDMEPKERKRMEKFLGKKEYEEVHRGYNVRPPKGESFADVEKRVNKFIKKLKKLIKKEKVNVAISAHGNSIRVFRKIMEKSSKAQAEKWFIPYDTYFKYTIKA